MNKIDKNNSKVDIVIIVPQIEEYLGVKRVFSASSAKSINLPHGGTYELCEIALKNQSYQVRVAIACMKGMYNYRCISLMERLLFYTEPKLAFLVGSACGNLSKVNILDVVVSTECVAYLGRGRRWDNTVNDRPYTEPVDPNMQEAISAYLMNKNIFNSWKRKCKKALKNNYNPLPDELSKISAFEIKPGIIASDDLVISWSDEDQANVFWK